MTRAETRVIVSPFVSRSTRILYFPSVQTALLTRFSRAFLHRRAPQGAKSNKLAPSPIARSTLYVRYIFPRSPVTKPSYLVLEKRKRFLRISAKPAGYCHTACITTVRMCMRVRVYLCVYVWMTLWMCGRMRWTREKYTSAQESGRRVAYLADRRERID